MTSEKKLNIVVRLKKLIVEYPIFGIVDLENLPSPQLQKMRKSLKGKAEVVMAKGRLMDIALDQASKEKKGVEILKESIDGMPAMIFTKDNPFKLYKILQDNKSSAPAKAGQTAPNDIFIKAGKTPFAPGPIIGELGQLGIKTAIEDGKVAVKEDKLVVKDGDVINGKTAEILTRLGIEPMEVGLNLLGLFEDGVIFTKKVLAIDETEYLDNIKLSYQETLNLAVKIGYPCKESIRLMVVKAHSDASALADSKDIITTENVGKILAKAEAQASSLKLKGNL
ncbi:50S ribosomal protein L10 [archaeon]|jgi:large subunit ribosomal protein L10|nr:50S ribosomal protein L10 [archaeon]MBT4416733.1 50S ribosomal protein L10 [archaeon]